MNIGEILRGWFFGDMWTLTGIWFVLLPFLLLGSAIKALADKARKR